MELSVPSEVFSPIAVRSIIDLNYLWRTFNRPILKENIEAVIVPSIYVECKKRAN